MATQDRSPSLLIGQQWLAWTEVLSSMDKNDDDTSSKEKLSSDSMKLGKNDMGLFGFCPARDEFAVVVCEKCNLLIKPQALKQHIESRHGPTNLSSLGNVPASALNSELGKKLLMPEPLKSSASTASSITTISSHQSSTATAKASSRPPTKASLKQVPASVHSVAAPRIGVSMKISPVKTVKSGNRISPGSSNATGKSKVISSNPVVKVEKLPERIPFIPVELSSSASISSSSTSSTFTISSTPSSSFLSPTLSSPEKKQTVSTVSTFSKPDSSKISTLVNGSLKTAVSLTTPSSMAFSSLFNNMSAVAPSSLVVTTKTSTDTPINSRSLSTLVTMSTLTKPIMIGPVMTVTTSTVTQFSQKPSTTTTSGVRSTKPQKDQKKFLPCKDREYDANKHCGVKAENGKACTRSLTCKTHALSLRRAVQGRCKSLDDLLKEHKAAKDALKAEANQNQGDASTATPNRTSSSPGQKGHPKSSASAGVKDTKSTTPGIGLKSASGVPTPSTSPQIKVSREHTNIFQRFSSSGVLPPVVTIKEETLSKAADTSSKPSVSSPTDVPCSDIRDSSFLPHHPRPLAMCQFGGRLNDRSCYLFSRKTDYVRAAVHSALERQLEPPPHKKLCVESKLPKEGQLFSNSHDPYEFNLFDTSGNNAGGSTVAGAGKPVVKPKSKPPSSPIAASLSSSSLPSSSPSLSIANSIAFSSASLSLTNPSSVVSSLALSTPLSSSCSSASSLTAIYPMTLNQPIVGKGAGRSATRNRDSMSGNKHNTDSNSSPGVVTPGKRKRSGSSGGHAGTNSGGNNPSILMAAAASVNGPISSSPAISISSSPGLTLNTVGELSQQHLGLTGIISSSALSNHQTRNLIAIPSVNLANAASLGGVGTTGKISATAGVAGGGNVHKNNSIIKDINLYLTGIDSSLVNGQYVNITSSQLAELAANSGQTLVLNNFSANNSNTNNTAAASAVLSSQPLTGSGASSATTTAGTPKPSKRSRSSGSRSHHPSSSINSSSVKTSAISHSLEGFKFIPSNSMIGPAIPSNTVLMDSSGLQGAAVLTSVTLAPGTNPTLVAITSSAGGGGTPNSNNTVSNNASQMLCADATSGQFTNPVLSNGLVGAPGHDKSVSNQRHHSSSVSKSYIQHHHHHHHHHHQQQQQQHKTGQLALGNVLQGSASSVGTVTTPAQLTANQPALFKPGSTFNLTKGVGGKLTVQPVSLNFPIVSQQGLAALTSAAKSHHHLQQQQHQQQHTLLVAATSAGSGGGMAEDPNSAAASVRVANKADLHLQAQISNAAPPGNLIS